MVLPLNHNEPTIMHIDLNSCFATVEQQANPLLRGKPVAVVAYDSPNGCIVSPSIEAKRFGIKTGMTKREGRMLCKDLITMMPDPPKYRDVHIKFRNLFMEYSPNVTPKSIDEAVIDFSGTPFIKRGLIDIGTEIKQRMRDEIGEWISCNVGIGTNRFLAKTAASLHKPDGLDLINHSNLEAIYSTLTLTDLCGINSRYEARLNAYDIHTPLEFLHAPLDVLRRQVFQSITGYYWFLRLRGWEIDAVDFGRKSYGKQYAIKGGTNDPKELSRILMKLTETMGRRLRHGGSTAKGIYVACIFKDWTHWHTGRTFNTEMYTTIELYKKVTLLLNKCPLDKKISKIAVSCFDLRSANVEQANLFESRSEKIRNASNATDKINDRYGEFILTPAVMMGMDEIVLDRIAFGGVKELEELYSN